MAFVKDNINAQSNPSDIDLHAPSFTVIAFTYVDDEGTLTGSGVSLFKIKHRGLHAQTTLLLRVSECIRVF